MFREGYIGVTKHTLSERLRQHKKEAAGGSTYAVHNAIRKYGSDLIVQPLLEADEEYCYCIEAKLRPSRHIGWNIAEGGGKSPMRGVTGEAHPNFGKSLSNETRAKIGVANSGRRNGLYGKTGDKNPFFGKRHSVETKDKLRHKPWEYAKSDKSVWASADTLYSLFCELTRKSHYTLSRMSGLEASKLFAIVQKFKSGWIPSSDLNWLAFKDIYGASSS